MLAMSQEDGAGEAKESRFGHLLQPIRDLAQNWNIDVASELEEYLSEIEKMQFAFEGNGETFNFAEAAMLIQSSACIYGKKVEYLYGLVYQTLDLLASKRKLAQSAAADSDEMPVEEQEEKFLPLDDIAEDGNIDLRHEAPLRDLLPRTPAGLLPVEHEFDYAITNAKGAVLGNRNDYRMNTSIVHESGALLLGLDERHLIDASFRRPEGSDSIVVAGDRPERVQEVVTQAQRADRQEPAPAAFDDYDDAPGVGGDYDDDFSFAGAQAAPPLTTSTPFAPAPAAATSPWARLDDHAAGEAKPFQRLKTTKLPKSLTAKHKAKPLDSIGHFCAQLYRPAEQQKLPTSRFLAPPFAELAPLFWAEQRRREQAFKVPATHITQAVSSAGPSGPSAPEIAPFDDYDNDGGGGFDYGAQSGDEYEPLPPPIEAPHILPAGPAHDGPADASLAYEELVRRHIDQYVAESQRYVRDSDLVRRVREWEARMRPLLEQEEARRPFDIHEYGVELLQELPRKKSTLPFAQIAAEHEVHDVCRYFLAALQLANTGHVEIASRGPGDLELRKLSDAAPNAQLDGFRAPSLKP